MDLHPSRFTPRVSPHWRAHPVTALLILLLVIFMVLFPKGGVKVGGVPLTWGYMLLGLSLVPLVAIRVFQLPLRFRLSTLFVIGCLLPFDVLFLYSFRVNGYDSIGWVVSDVTSFVVLPIAFLLTYPAFLRYVDGVQLERLIRFCMLIAALFGIFLFVLYPLTHKLFEIPYLTVNADDFGQIENKNISRGALLKLISTYNNGNLYGVATLILLPLYNHFEKKTWRRNVMKLALILTLSRTVWVGLMLEQILSLGRLMLGFAVTFPRFHPGPALKRFLFLVVTAGGVAAGLILGFGDLSFLFDQNLGGRSAGLTASLQHITLLPAIPILPFSEILYSSALAEYGIAGALSILLLFASPILLLVANRKVLTSPIRSAALKGLILYMMVSCMDAAISLIPVMVFYWFTYMIFLEGWPGMPERTLVSEPIPDSNAIPAEPYGLGAGV